jgi:hypothetical protein
MEMAGNLDPANEAGVRAILTEALECGLSDFQTEMLIGRLNKKAHVGVKAIRNLLRAVGAKTVEAVSPEERARREQEDEQRRRREANEAREALGRSCDKIASSPTLLADMEAVVHTLGVVGEDAAIRGGYLAATSRLLRKRAISLLRRGAAGVSSLYGVKTRREVVAVVKAVEDIGGNLDESVKVTVAAVRDKLGINSKSVAAARLIEAAERGALELDEEKSGSGKGRPRYFKLLKTSSQIAAEQGQGVFPPPEDVLRKINYRSSVSSGHADKTDKKDEAINFGHRAAAPEKKPPPWSVRL